MKRTHLSALVALFAAVPSTACAQSNGLFFNFPSGNVYTGAKPVEVEVWAFFNASTYFAWAGWNASVIGDTTGSFSNPLLANPTPPPGTSAGTPGMNVTSIVAGQLHFPPVFFANTANPILIWSAEWSSANLSKRTVGIETDSTKFSLYGIGLPNPTIYDEAEGVIQVVPTPAGALVLVLAAIGQRRRCR